MAKSTLEGLHAIAYCRVSTADKGQTTATQRRLIGEWADRVGVVVDEYFNDDGKSGDMWPRPGLAMALLSLNNSPTAVILVAYDESRLTRSAGRDLPEIKKSLKPGALIRYAVYGDDDPDTLGARITQAVRGEMNTAELEQLHAKTRQGMKTRKDAGQHVGRPAKLIITDADPRTLPRGLIQVPDGTITPGCNRDNDELQRHYDGYKRGTRVLTTAEVLSYARAGWTIYKVSKLLAVSPETLARRMSDANIRDQYDAILAQYRDRQGATI